MQGCVDVRALDGGSEGWLDEVGGLGGDGSVFVTGGIDYLLQEVFEFLFVVRDRKEESSFLDVEREGGGGEELGE